MNCRLYERISFCLSVMTIVNITLAEDRWGSISDYRDVRGMHYQDNSIWAATSGGLVKLDLNGLKFDKYTMEDGMGGTGIYSMVADTIGGLWLAFENGTIQKFQIGQGVTHEVLGFDFESGINRVNQMDISSKGLFLATNRGIARIVYTEEFDRWVWFEEYTLLGEFPTNQPVNTLKVEGDYIWAGTDIGVARGDLNTPSPLDWENFTIDNGLRSNEIKDIDNFEDQILVVTSSGISSWMNGDWQLFSTIADAKSLVVIGDSLRAIRSQGVYTRKGDQWEINIPLRNHVRSVVWDDDGKVWVGMKFDKIAAYRGGIATAVDTGFTE